MASSGVTTAVEAVSSGRLGERVKGVTPGAGIDAGRACGALRGEQGHDLQARTRREEPDAGRRGEAGRGPRRDALAARWHGGAARGRHRPEGEAHGHARPRDRIRAPTPLAKLRRAGRRIHTEQNTRGLHFGRIPAAPQGRRGADSRRARNPEGDASRRGVPAQARATPYTSRPTYRTASTTRATENAATTWSSAPGRHDSESG